MLIKPLKTVHRDSFPFLIKSLFHLPSTIFPRYVLSVEVSLSVPHDSSEAFRLYVSHREVKPAKNIQKASVYVTAVLKENNTFFLGS